MSSRPQLFWSFDFLIRFRTRESSSVSNASPFSFRILLGTVKIASFSYRTKNSFSELTSKSVCKGGLTALISAPSNDFSFCHYCLEFVFFCSIKMFAETSFWPVWHIDPSFLTNIQIPFIAPTTPRKVVCKFKSNHNNGIFTKTNK